MAGEKERLAGIAVPWLEKIDFNDIEELLGTFELPGFERHLSSSIN